MSFGFFDWLSPKPKARRASSSSPSSLAGFPGTPAYGGRTKAARSASGLIGFLGFPSTPAYQDASIEPECPKPEPEPDPECPDPEGDSETSADEAAASSSESRGHGTR